MLRCLPWLAADVALGRLDDEDKPDPVFSTDYLPLEPGLCSCALSTAYRGELHEAEMAAARAEAEAAKAARAAKR